MDICGILSFYCLQNRLNNQYDPEQRRIRVIREKRQQPLELFKESEPSSVFLFQPNESHSKAVYKEIETEARELYIIILPKGFSINQIDIKIKRVKSLSRYNFQIQYI